MSMIRGTFVLLRAGALRLLLPQADAGPAEYLGERPVRSAVPGMLRSPHGGDGRTYAALSGAMTLLPDCPPERFIASVLDCASEAIVWCWDELRVLIDVEMELFPLPCALATSSTPVAEYVELEGAPAFLCSAQELCRFALRGLEAGNAT